MSSAQSQYNIDVLVVGAGPVGLVAALVLAQNGVSVRIIDKSPNFDHIGQRGAGLQPRSLEAYKFLGVLDDFIKKGTFEISNMRSYDAEGKPTAQVPFRSKMEPTPEIPLPNGMTLGQDSNCAILRSHLSKFGVQVELSTEMVSFEQDDDSIIVTLKVNGAEEQTETVRAKFLVGADGAKGPTRRTAGINFVGATDMDIRAVIGDIELLNFDTEEEVRDMIMHNFSDANKNRTLIRRIPEDPSAYFIFFVATTFPPQRLMESKDFLQEQLRLISHRPELVVHKVRNVAEWKLNERVADHLQVGRVFIAGDAGHCHSPVGGQGLNSGVLDAMNLAWKLAFTLKHSSPLTLLSTYEEERLPVLREMLRMTNSMASKAFKSTDMSKAAWQRPPALRQLGVHCRWSSVVFDELLEGGAGDVEGTSVEPEDVYGKDKSERLRAGDRAPDAPGLVDGQGKSTELFDILKPTYHTVVVLDKSILRAVAAVAAGYPKGSVRVIAALPEGHGVAGVDVYTDSQGHAQRAYGVEAGVKVAVIRPDGVVGGLLKGSGGLQKYFSKIFT
ncbi:unnamed protein product [Peniophora sp. CBMAI 1063]|nr:unnamed protein product [Peniophora sp. CBMAI 1063]